MKKEFSHIEALLERFFEGATSRAEERELYAFFAGDDVPQDLLRYRELFGWFDAGIRAQNEAATHAPSPRPKRRLGLWAAAVAAAVVLLALLIRPPLRQADPDPDAGSYIVRNGVKITDPAIVGPAVEEALQRIAEEDANRQCQELEAYLIAEMAWCMETEEWIKSL